MAVGSKPYQRHETIVSSLLLFGSSVLLLAPLTVLDLSIAAVDNSYDPTQYFLCAGQTYRDHRDSGTTSLRSQSYDQLDDLSMIHFRNHDSSCWPRVRHIKDTQAHRATYTCTYFGTDIFLRL